MIFNKKLMVTIVSIVTIFGIIAYLRYFPVSLQGRWEYSHEPVASVESGFYDEPFELELKAAPFCTIYYTVDGSEPTQNSDVYEGPILITDCMREGDLYAGIKQVSNDDYWDNQFVLPDDEGAGYIADQAAIIRFRAKSNLTGQSTNTVTKTYFIGLEKKYSDLENVVSLVCNPQDLFDNQKGIYTADNCKNYGPEWEKQANVEFFSKDEDASLKDADASSKDADGSFSQVASYQVGLRIQGGETRALPQKSLSLRNPRDFKGSSCTFSNIFGDSSKEELILYSNGDDYITKLRDPLVQEVFRDCDFATLDMKPAYVFLNGDFWGLYYITEKFNEKYIGEHFNVADDNILMIKNREAEVGDREADAEYAKLLETDDFFGLADMDSFTSYYGAMTLLARVNDWPEINEAFWKTRKQDNDSAYGDCKWRWMLFDLNWEGGGMTRKAIDFDSFSYLDEHSVFWNKAKSNPLFAEKFVTRVLDLINTRFYPERTEAIINNQATRIQDAVYKNYDRYFYGRYSDRNYHAKLENLRSFYDERGEWIIWQMKKYFNLQGTLETVAIMSTNPEGGEILINNMTTELDEDGKWSGRYFTDFGCQLSAIPNEGYRFNGWMLSDGRMVPENDISVQVVTGGVAAIAVFEPIQ